MSSADDADDAAAISATNAAFYQAIEGADLDLMGSIWDTADDVRCVHPGAAMVSGRSAVMRSWAVVMAGTPYIQFFITDVGVSLVGDVALVVCNENVLTGVETPDGSPSGFAGGKAVATNVYRRTPAGWRLWAHHSSPVMSASDAPDDDEQEDQHG